jgi:endogenous inhibitor of DNA gyrase (YacG/DUF329 family)
MRSLIPCSSCNRHVESEETSCPFCGAALTPQSLATPHCSGRCSGPPEVRLGRAALLVAGAALLGAACHGAMPVPAYGGAGGTSPPQAELQQQADVDQQADTEQPDGGPDAHDAGDAKK